MMLVLNRHLLGYGQGVYIVRRLSLQVCNGYTVGGEKHEALFPTTPDVEIVLVPKVPTSATPTPLGGCDSLHASALQRPTS